MPAGVGLRVPHAHVAVLVGAGAEGAVGYRRSVAASSGALQHTRPGDPRQDTRQGGGLRRL